MAGLMKLIGSVGEWDACLQAWRNYRAVASVDSACLGDVCHAPSASQAVTTGSVVEPPLSPDGAADTTARSEPGGDKSRSSNGAADVSQSDAVGKSSESPLDGLPAKRRKTCDREVIAEDTVTFRISCKCSGVAAKCFDSQVCF